MYRKTIYIVFVFVYCSLIVPINAQISFYVSPKGNDSNSGTLEMPFATLERARDAVRTVEKSRSSQITIFLREGYYELSDSFVLDSLDSGNDGSPIVYTAFKEEVVHLIGGKKITGFEPVKKSAILNRFNRFAREKILQLNLKEKGIDNYGQLARRGFGLGNTISGMELFCNNKPMTLARWPNTGWVSIDSIPHGNDSSKFYYENSRLALWEKSNSVWIHGYWKWDWADSYEQIKNINTTDHSIETYPPHGVYGYTKNKRFYFLNILEELDSPGEWYLDTDEGILYFYPPNKIENAEVFVSMLNKPLVSFRYCSHVSLRKITIAYGRSSGVHVVGGSSITIDSCTICNIGTTGIVMQGGDGHAITSCTITQTGNGGIWADGGDRIHLTSSKYRIENNTITEFGRWSRTYQPGISLNGVGITVRCNEIANAPHSAIIITGNDHVIEYNDIHDVCTETDDAGAIYMGRDLTARGILIHYNKISNIKSEIVKLGAAASSSISGIYLDDFSSGVDMYGNIFYRTGRGVEIGCGRDNIINNNIFIECNPGVLFGKRGWDGKNIWYYDDLGTAVMNNLHAVPFQNQIWSRKYPALANILNDRFGIPKGNRVLNNKYANCDLVKSFPESTDSLLFVSNNKSIEIPSSYKMENDKINYLNSFKSNGFDPLPTKNIGTNTGFK